MLDPALNIYGSTVCLMLFHVSYTEHQSQRSKKPADLLLRWLITFTWGPRTTAARIITVNSDNITTFTGEI